VYKAIKTGKNGEKALYFGKAKFSIFQRYTRKTIEEMDVTVIPGLEKIPSNAVALGVEQILIDLHGGVGPAGTLANKIPATVKEIYINEARYWLDNNVTNWGKLYRSLK